MRVRHGLWAALWLAASLPGRAAVPDGWPAYLTVWRDRLPAGLQLRLAPVDGMPQVLVPGGEFQLGSADGVGKPDEHPRKRVKVTAFWMDLHPLTNAQFARFAEATHAEVSSFWQRWAAETGPLYPAVYVSWDDACAYAKWVKRALPSEAQWERAARAGLEDRLYPWGDQPSADLANGNWDQTRISDPATARQFTRPVASYAPSAYGLHDMCGNVGQWVRDNYATDGYTLLTGDDPVLDNGGERRVTRGGSWFSSPDQLRVARRAWLPANTHVRDVGCRTVAAP